ncbi:helix-turn-helix domain-containing protein [Rathayibacter soli]|uniref:helix-turn-helix domain-containing protein n=1 Tax=Rathayibacter soli TaxID=3144168 RepID=UPI0027E454C2|nr:helix-turn-helix domain-containing protein [Glaciibacter superstes]
MEPAEFAKQLRTTDPLIGLRAVGALHRLAERVEATHVAEARRAGWSWEQIGDALGVTRQSVHAKYGKHDGGRQKNETQGNDV